MHPLVPDLSKFTDDELQKKYNDLYKKFSTVSRAHNGVLISQIVMLLEDYRTEIANRQQALLDKTSKQNPNFKNIIDIQ